MASVVGALAYLFNLYVVSTVNANPVFIAALALLPVLSGLVLASAFRDLSPLAAAALIACTSPLVGYAYLNPPLVGMVVGGVVASPLLAWWLADRSAALRAAGTVSLGLLVLALVSSYWAIPAFFQLESVANHQLAALSSWVWTEGRATLRNGFWLNNVWSWDFKEYFPYAALYDRLPLSLLSFFLPVVAFGALLIRRSASLILATSASSLALFTILLSTGTNPPGNMIFNGVYGLPFGWLLREPGRFQMASGLALAVMLAVSFEAFVESRWLRRVVGLKLGRLQPIERLVAVPVIVLLLAAAFPLATGAIVPDRRPNLPPAHVKLPAYWEEMGRAIDGVKTTGPVLVLPPDDFYQMPYNWGYYGADTFISNLTSRPALVPNRDGYTPASKEVIAAVNLISTSLLEGDWRLTDRIADALGTPLVLVRGDIKVPSPPRNIVSPAALTAALERAPNFQLVRRIGPLSLFARRGAVSPHLEAVSSFATVETDSPDLRALSLLPDGAFLVTSSPRTGIPRLIEVRPVTDWVREQGNLTWSMEEPSGWRYDVVALQPDGSHAPLSEHEVKGIMANVSNDGRGSKVLRLSVRGREALINANFEDGMWSAVGNCNDVHGAEALPYLSASPIRNSPNGSGVRLMAKLDSACIQQPFAWHGGALHVSALVHRVGGAPPRMCIWQAGPDRCAPLPSVPEREGWFEYRGSVIPEIGTKSLSLYLYAEATPHGATISEYADVHVMELPSLPQVVLVGRPDGGVPSRLALTVLKEGFSRRWQGPQGSNHVLVDGMLNGWLGPEPRSAIIRYSASRAMALGVLASGVGCVCALCLLLVAWLASRGRPGMNASVRRTD
jgi:hypothetical protein